MIDTHCHLDVEAFAHDRDAVVARAAAAGVVGLLVPAIRPRTWPALLELARAHPAIRVALGSHPQIVPELSPDELAIDLAVAIAAAGPVVVAVGECGLDGGTPDAALQQTVFRAHIRAARAASLPLVVHVLRAHDVAPRILREERAHDVGGVLHSYSGGAELVAIYRDLGFAFSFAGPVTYPNARRPIAAVRAVPDALLLVETDAPDQWQGRSEPAFLPAIVDAIAAARDTDAGAIAALTATNARRLFAAW